jgi:hypothetical protein
MIFGIVELGAGMLRSEDGQSWHIMESELIAGKGSTPGRTLILVPGGVYCPYSEAGKAIPPSQLRSRPPSGR